MAVPWVIPPSPLQDLIEMCRRAAAKLLSITRLLEDILEEDEEDAILPPNLSSRPGSLPSPTQDLIEMC